MEVSDFLITKCVWGTGVAFNIIEAGNYYSTVHIYYDSSKTRETCVHIGYFIHSGVFMCFYKIVIWVSGIQRFPISGIGS